MSLPLVLASLALCLFLSNSKAQSVAPPVAHCLGYEQPATQWTWMQNSKGQSACEVASDLQISCVGKDSAVLQGLLDSGDYYKGPSGQSPCVCNTVMYSLIAGCQLCQYDVPSALLAWSVYASNCTDRTNGSYPNSVPSGTAIPAWAYQDVMANDRFDLATAQEVAAQGLPDVTGFPTSSGASSTGTATPTTSSNPTARNVGPIVGGVVGGVLGVLLVGTIVTCLLLRKRKIRRQAQADPPEASERPISTATDVDSHQPSLKPMSMTYTPSMIYDPDDPRTFPTFQTSPSPSEMRAASLTISGPSPGSVGGYMPHSFGAMQDYSGSSFYGGDYGHGNSASTYKGVPEV